MYIAQLQLAILYVINTQYHLLNEIYRDRKRYIPTNIDLSSAPLKNKAAEIVLKCILVGEEQVSSCLIVVNFILAISYNSIFFHIVIVSHDHIL